MTGLVYPRSGFIGFDHIFDQLENIHKHAKDTYPPHNVVKENEFKFTLELAVAGFKQEHIDIEVNDGVLNLDTIGALPDDDVCRELIQVNGKDLP